MFDGIKFIVEFIVSIYEHIVQLFTLFGDGVAIISTASFFAPSFLGPILTLTLSVVIIMWVVNLF